MLHFYSNRAIPGSSFGLNLKKEPLNKIRFLLNGKLIELSEGQFDPTDSLVTYLRSEEINLKGTKRGCDEGGCGACTVIMSSYDPIFHRIKHHAINSCLFPLGNLHNTSITTIERLTQNDVQKTKTSEVTLNPIQEAIRKHHATQCGFCTPGFIMSILAILLENPSPTSEDMMQYLDGNICRCTGYRSIIEALREFTVDSNPNDQIISQKLNKKDKKSLNQEIVDSLQSISDLSVLKPTSKSVHIKYNGHFYSLPSTFEELLEIKKKNQTAKIMVGNTELFCSSASNDKFDYISTCLVDELKYIKMIDNVVHIGASTTIDDVLEFCKKDDTKNRVLKALKEKILLFASNQTRNVASMVGNLVAASPSTDFTNFLPGVGAKMKIVDCVTKEQREISFDDFFVDRYQTILKETDVIKEISFNIISLNDKNPKNENTDHVCVYKIANRREMAGCILSATFRADISETNNIINDIHLAFSKLSYMKPIGRAKKAEKFLIGKEFSLENIKKSFCCIDDEFPISDEFDDGLDKYRRNVAHNLLIKFYHQIQKERGKSKDEYDESIVNNSYFSTTFKNLKKSFQNLDYFELSNSHIPEFSVSCQCKDNGTTVPMSRLSGSEAIGKSVTHLSSPLQVQGKAEFTDDIPLNVQTKHAAFVTSTIAHGYIKRINYKTDELKKKDFKIITADDLIKEANHVGPNKEEFLASKEVTYYGQPIAIVVAKNEREAWRIAKMIQVEYEPLPVISCIEESIKNGKVFDGPSLAQGEDVEKIFNKINQDQNSNYKILEGSVKMGGQYHFYLEPNASVTKCSDGQYYINPTTRDLDSARDEAARHLGIGSNHINVNVKRLGGAFCSKLNRSSIVSNATTIASHKFKCPIKMRLPRDVDTHLMSGDHCVLANYKVAFDSKTGKIEALKIDFFIDSGFSYENTSEIAMMILLHSDSVYNFKNIQFNSYLCQTNKISNAHFRGSGSQNAGIISESIFERISHFLNDQINNKINDVKSSNFYKLNDKTPYGVTLDDINIDQCWSLIKEKSRFSELKRCVRSFNIISKNKKRGLAITPVKFGVGNSFAPSRRATSIVHLLKDGTVLISHSGVEIGQGLHTKMTCVAAKVLDIPVDFIRIEKTDTSINADSSSTSYGYTNDLVGFAIIDACEKIKKRIEPFYYYNDKNGHKIRRPFSDVVKMAYMAKIDLTEHGFYISPQPGFNDKTKKGRPYQYYEYGAGVALVEIDILTGEIKILESHVVLDAGQSLNPGIDIGQIEGGFMQGIGWMTSEEVKYMPNKESGIQQILPPGKPLNDTMYKYKLPAMSSLPLKFSAHLLPDSHNKIGVMSSKGIGEPPNMLANCVGFALFDAIEAYRKEKGKKRLTHYEFPLTPDKIIHYLTM